MQKNGPGLVVWKLAAGWKAYKLGGKYYIAAWKSVPEGGEEIKKLPAGVHLVRVSKEGEYKPFQIVSL